MLYYLFALVSGFISGSFVSMASYRIPNELSLKGRSKCVKCNYVLKPLELVPLLSYAVQNGKCKSCKADISMKYPLIELINGFIYLINVVIIEDYKLAILVCLVTTIILIIIVSDLEYFIIPDQMVISLAMLGLIFAYLKNYSLIQIITLPTAMLLLTILMKISAKHFFKREALGMGDVKFFAASALYLQVELIASFLLITGGVGIIFGLIWRFRDKGDYLPFGPALCSSLYLCILFPDYLDINFIWINPC